MKGPSAFWSYVHADDKDEGKRITQLADLLSRRVRLLTGEPFPIFLDRESIGWGDDWESKIDEALIKTTFFIPILTPSYFRSEACRNELIRFSSTAKALGLDELILPIYYVTIPELDSAPPSGDDLIDQMRRYQWADWRKTALEDSESSIHRKQVDALAQQLLKSVAQADAKPAIAELVPRAGDSGVQQQRGEDDKPGVVDILAEGEGALERLNTLLEQYSPVMKVISDRTTEGTNRIKRSDTQGKGFSGRLLAGRWLATELTGPAEQLEKLAAAFLEELLKVDQMVVTIFQIARRPNESEDRDAVANFVKTVLYMVDAAETGLGKVDELAVTVHENLNWSKDLRKPLQRIERALRQFADARAVFRQWRSLTDGI